jgi:hypothetical protein
MEHIHNNLMKSGGSLGNLPQKLKNINKNQIFFGLLVHFQEYFIFSINSPKYMELFLTRFFKICGTLPSYPSNLIRLFLLSNNIEN